MKTKLLALSLMSILSFSAAQADQVWGSHTPTESVGFQVSYDSFYDKYFYFSLDKTSNLKATAANNFNRVSSNTVDLLNFDTGEDLGFFNFGTTPTVAYFNNISPGNYFYEVSGANYGTQVGQVTFTSQINNAVPEPATYALVFVALGALSLVARGRRSL